MSNRIVFQPTKFEDVRNGGVSFGFRAHDDYGQAYDNTWDVIPDDDLEFIAKVAQSDDETVSAMFDSVKEHETGVFVGSVYYPLDKFAHLLPV